MARKIIFIAGALALSAAFFFVKLPEVFIVNLSPSLPRGLYLVSARPPEAGDYVLIPPGLVAVAHDTGAGVRLLKKVAYASGEEVFIGRSFMAVDGAIYAKFRDEGVEFRGCLAPGECIVIGRHERSFDSRYFGPVEMAACTRVVPLFLAGKP
jgi:type IV secretory pathway protease TraF